MPDAPDVSVIVTTYQRPRSLQRVLASLAAQQFSGQMEVIVADDGSSDSTERIVSQHAAEAPFEVQYVTHRHDGFQLARCRNEGAAAARASYLIFLDGDCLAPSEHVAQHIRLRRPRTVVAGAAYYLTQQQSRQLVAPPGNRRLPLRAALAAARRELRRAQWKAQVYSFFRHASKPRLRGGNFGIARDDFYRVNGFDENFRGWGCEDDDLGMRLRRVGCAIRPALRSIPTIHLWHPLEPSYPSRWREGANVAYLHRPLRWTRCLNGLEKRAASQLTYLAVGGARKMSAKLEQWLAPATEALSVDHLPVDIEVAVAPAAPRFTGHADCNVLVIPADARATTRSLRLADVVLSNQPLAGAAEMKRIAENRFRRLLTDSLSASAGEGPPDTRSNAA